MTKDQFLSSLRSHLSGVPYGEAAEIIRDQEEYIRDAVASGRSEQEVINSLGDPRSFALSLSVENHLSGANNSTSVKSELASLGNAVIAILALAPLNILFVFGPLLLIGTLLFSGWAVGLALLFVSLILLPLLLGKFFFWSLGAWLLLSALFLSLGTIGTCVLGLMLLFAITKFLCKSLAAYLKWNLNFVRARS